MSGGGNNHDFDALLDYLKHSRGFDFSVYKRPGLMRRVEKRMQTVTVDGYGAYVDYLEVHPDEFGLLFNTILINVTGFFRDPAAWEYLAGTVLPKVVGGKRPNEPLRVWSAGCASGEEVYTLAILLAEQMGEEAFRERVKIYATDVDQEVLNKARLASFTPQEVEEIPPPLLAKYFEKNGSHYAFQKDLRRSVIFGRLDLIQDAPISRIDLLVCRNTLMYFHAEAQARILARFHFALNDNGFLFLGKAEMLLTHSSLFVPVDLRLRVFTKTARPHLRDRLLLMAQNDGADTIEPAMLNHERFREVAFETDPLAQVVVDQGGMLALASEKARTMFNLTPKDLGRPFRDLEVSFRPLELRSHIEAASTRRMPVQVKEVSWLSPSGGQKYLDVQVVPLIDVNGSALGVKVVFADVTVMKHLQEELQRSNQELETANEEIQTSNEELQSTNEELETTNEELQSTNEELETMNEELQSTNEELRTINDELHVRTEELNQVNSFLESILTSLRGAVVVLDKSYQVQIWNHKAEDLWGLRSEEVVGQNFYGLDIGLPVDRLKAALKACLSGDSPTQEVTLEAVTRRGKSGRCHVICSPLLGMQKDIQGTILLMEEGAGDHGAPCASAKGGG